MTGERAMGAEALPNVPEGDPARDRAAGERPPSEVTAAMKLQMLSTEHWSLLATRSLSWNEAFSRASMFLSALSGAVVALALVAQAMSFGDQFLIFALLLLPVVLFLGIATYARLVEINSEDMRWVQGMNILRRAYLELAPELERYFITGTYDDERNVLRTFAATPGPGTFAHNFVTTPGMVCVVVAAVAGVLAGTVSVAFSLSVPVILAVGVGAFVVTVIGLTTWAYRRGASTWREFPPRFPEPGPEQRVDA